VPKVLLVEDDPSLAKLVRFTLEAERCVTDHVTNSASAIIAMKNEEYDILILDWSLPDGTGLDLCKHYRSMGGTKPIMMLTARHASVDKVAALSAGADDYVVKPFDPDELAARIKALLRRPPLMMDSILRVGAIELDKVNFWVKKGGNFTAEAILARVWRSDLPVSTDSVRTHVKSLRKKLGDVIDSSRGLGYRMNAEAQ
jgi:DNA-binding response OmpR family regulator